MSVSSRPRCACKAILRPCAFPMFERLRFFSGGRLWFSAADATARHLDPSIADGRDMAAPLLRSVKLPPAVSLPWLASSPGSFTLTDCFPLSLGFRYRPWATCHDSGVT
jgi:hypothetical protein